MGSAPIRYVLRRTSSVRQRTPDTGKTNKASAIRTESSGLEYDFMRIIQGRESPDPVFYPATHIQAL